MACTFLARSAKVGCVPGARSDAAVKLGLRVRKERLRLGATQRQIAEAAEIDEASYRKIELGHRNLSLHNLIRIADALGVDLGVLTTGLSVDLVPPPVVRMGSRGSLDILKRQRDARQGGNSRLS